MMCDGQCAGKSVKICDGCYRQDLTALQLINKLKLIYCGGTAMSGDSEIKRIQSSVWVTRTLLNMLNTELAEIKRSR